MLDDYFYIEAKGDAEIIVIQYLEAIMHRTKRLKLYVSEQYVLKYITISTVSSLFFFRIFKHLCSFHH